MISRLAIAAVVLALAGCNQGDKAEIPPPAAFDPNAIAHFCGMAVGEHTGPKGQIWVGGELKPVWFTSVRGTLAFTFLPEEPKDVRAIYVSDMAKAPSWEQAVAGGWVDARQAFFVIGADVAGGMGETEVVPFSDQGVAASYAALHGGRVARFADIAAQDVLGYSVSSNTASTVR